MMITQEDIAERNKCDRFMCRAINEDSKKIEYGYLFRNKKKVEMLINSETGTMWFFKKETLSQCTEVKDSNGVMIFENDIVMLGDRIGVVEWSEGDWHVYLFKVKRHDNWFKFSEVYSDDENIKIIGDKFSNPELLEV